MQEPVEDCGGEDVVAEDGAPLNRKWHVFVRRLWALSLTDSASRASW